MDAITRGHGVELGVDPAIKEQALAYLVVVLEDRHENRLEEDTGELAGLLGALGALDVYVLPSAAVISSPGARSSNIRLSARTTAFAMVSFRESSTILPPPARR